MARGYSINPTTQKCLFAEPLQHTAFNYNVLVATHEQLSLFCKIQKKNLYVTFILEEF
jgi:hypothetical protein